MQQNEVYLGLVLHAHQPYVLHHGTWPHGLEWILEAAADTYLPLIDTLQRLESERIKLNANVSLSPVLLEQLAHHDFRQELPRYLERKVVAAQEDAAFFEQAGEAHLNALAKRWEALFQRKLEILATLNGDLIAGFRAAEESGSICLLTSAASHAYAPLIGTDESLRAQFQTAVAAHRRHFGRQPRGVWLPECGYRPAGVWNYPVPMRGAEHTSAVPRIGVERALSEAGLRWTFVDSHLVDDAQLADVESTYKGTRTGESRRSLYRPHTIAESKVAAFARDPRSAFQVWSSQFGYPGDFSYLDFHKKRWPGGHRYWRVTGENLDMSQKEVYFADAARERAAVHAAHFVALVEETLHQQVQEDGAAPFLCAPFDLELFGHWWHEGVAFLENVARLLAHTSGAVKPITCADYLQHNGTGSALRMHEGSWGAGGDSSVWLNGETGDLLSRVYQAELAVRDASKIEGWKDGATGERIAKQLCRELLLMQASDWPTLITTGAARDYAERRFVEHASSFDSVLGIWTHFVQDGAFSEAMERELVAFETRDALFPDIDPANWRDNTTSNDGS